MDILLITIALLLPVLLGSLWLDLLVPANCKARTATVWGNGTLIGLLLLPQIMLAVDRLEIALTFGNISIPVIALIGLALLLRYLKENTADNPQVAPPAKPIRHRWHQALFALMLALITVRVCSLGLEVLARPLFPWDATMHWATKARVWFEHGGMTPFVPNGAWLMGGGVDVFTDRHPEYPPMIPLLQVWMNLAIDRWDESIMNLPWLLCLIALGAAFFGQLKNSGVSRHMSITFTYLLLSMPLVNIHVALAGYADLFLGATFCAALMAFHNWTINRQAWQAFLALLLAVACLLIKNEGAVWPLAMIPGLATVFMARREAAKLFLQICLTGILLWLVLPEDMMFLGHTLQQLQPAFNPGALVGIIKSVFLHDNWHLFGYMMMALIPLGLLMPGALTRTFLPITVTLACCVGALLYLFLLTGYGYGASHFTAVGRLSIQVAPGLIFLAALLFNELIVRDGLRVKEEKASTGD